MENYLPETALERKALQSLQSLLFGEAAHQNYSDAVSSSRLLYST